ncbi:MAG: NUDIX hydrolase [Candidatus Zixiibacteriota bacterium]|nr:MAG: NUDIX hydrolase [candidate division Zixibacteria bacterium]
MSFLAPQIPRMEELYGRPDEAAFVQPVTPDEYERISRSMKNGRAHDITLYIKKESGYIFIAKHFYPPGLYRAPSGAAKPGEDFQDGARREAREETGVDIELVRYIMRINVRFENEAIHIDWTSHIFLADYIKGDIEPRDKREIKEARLIYPGEMPGFAKKMRETKVGGLNYRAFLTEEVGKRLKHDKFPKT